MFTPLPDSLAGHGVTWPISLDLAALRDLVCHHARQAGLSPQCAGDLALAANEAVTNVLDHAGGRGWVRIWADDGFLTVEVVDLAGRLGPGARLDEPPQAGPRGYGLWVMRRLCDEFAITQQSGSSRVRLRMRRPTTRRS
ncbi:ATP-binding protein [Nonomuraea fuscirosea]|uniref:ATP-binding protein n=1 Tax=Nonomuraea fuscirosea TaxID=1291556 RepID=UPI00342AC13B